MLISVFALFCCQSLGITGNSIGCRCGLGTREANVVVELETSDGCWASEYNQHRRYKDCWFVKIHALHKVTYVNNIIIPSYTKVYPDGVSWTYKIAEVSELDYKVTLQLVSTDSALSYSGFFTPPYPSATKANKHV